MIALMMKIFVVFSKVFSPLNSLCVLDIYTLEDLKPPLAIPSSRVNVAPTGCGFKSSSV
jgi:hypothetical protein